MNIVMLVNSGGAPGGVNRVVENLAVGFERAGHSARVLSVWGGATSLLPAYSLRLTRALSRSRYLDYVSKIVRADVLGQTLATHRLRRLVPDTSATVILAMDVLAAQLLARAKFSRALTMAQYHNSYVALSSGRDLSRLLSAGRRLDRTLMLTSEDWELLSRHEVGVRGGFMRVPTVVEGRRAVSEDKSKLVVGLGRYEESKNFAMLLSAWAEIVDAVPGWQLRLYGQGSQQALLERLVNRLGICETAAVQGPTPCPDAVLAESSLLALPSQYEGMPLVILEAYAQGTPVVATDCSPGVRSLISEADSGWLVPVADVGAFASMLRHAMADGAARTQKGRNGRRYVAAFDLPRVVQDWLTLIDSVRSERDRAGK